MNLVDNQVISNMYLVCFGLSSWTLQAEFYHKDHGDPYLALVEHEKKIY